MQISQNYSIYSSSAGIKQNQKPVSRVAFGGHANLEKCSVNGIKTLIQQTSMGRDLKTKNFVCKYIQDILGHKDSINIVSAGCSTGEEAVTWSMLLYNMRNRVNILGFDLGKKAIEQANSRKFIFEVPRKKTEFLTYLESSNASPYSDTFLLSNDSSGLTADQKRLHSLFNEFFIPTNRKIKRSFWERLQNMIDESMSQDVIITDKVEYALKDGMAENCKFQCGDVQNIDKILNGKKADAISFCNALYHLTTKDPTSDLRVPKENAEEIIENLMTKFKHCLNDKGLVVFGENEAVQMGDGSMVPKVMKKLGFNPLNATDQHPANVWQKG